MIRMLSTEAKEDRGNASCFVAEFMTKEQNERFRRDKRGVFFHLVTPEEKALFESVYTWLQNNVELLREKYKECQDIYEGSALVSLGQDKDAGPRLWAFDLLPVIEDTIKMQENVLDIIEEMLEEYGTFNDKDDHLERLYWELEDLEPARGQSYDDAILTGEITGADNFETKPRRELVQEKKREIEDYKKQYHDELDPEWFWYEDEEETEEER